MERPDAVATPFLLSETGSKTFVFQTMVYSKGCHTVFYHRYHVVWATKYRYQVLVGDLRLRVRQIIRQVCDELDVQIVKGALSKDHVHMVITVPPNQAISDVMRRIKGRSSRRIQQAFPAIRKRYWGCHFWARGYFSTTSGNITDDVILQYLENHLTKPTGVSR